MLTGILAFNLQHEFGICRDSHALGVLHVEETLAKELTCRKSEDQITSVCGNTTKLADYLHHRHLCINPSHDFAP
jgi:hypothetical protein